MEDKFPERGALGKISGTLAGNRADGTETERREHVNPPN